MLSKLTPVAKPSMPSIKFTAFVQQISHTMLATTPITGDMCTVESRTPKEIAKPAAPTCPASFCQGLSPRRSSSNPTAKITMLAGRTACNICAC